MKVIVLRIEEDTPEGLKTIDRRILEQNLYSTTLDPAVVLYSILERMKGEFDGYKTTK